MTATRTSYHHGDLRRALLDAAQRTVRERGVSELSLRELARETGVSHGAPRRHFPDRRALLDALAQAGFERLRADLEDAIAAAGPEFEPRLHATAAAYVRFAVDDAALLELMFAGKHRAGADVLLDTAEATFDVMLALIAQGQAERRLEPGDPEQVGLVLFATLHGIATLVSAGMVDPERLPELLDESVARFLRGARPGSTSLTR